MAYDLWSKWIHRVDFSKFLKKGGSDFFHKTRGVGKIGAQGVGGWGCFKREGVSVMFKLTLSSVFFQYLSVCLVCVCVLFIYTISISIICVSQEKPSLIASNQQIYDIYKWIIFEKKRHCGK